jgi:hypothetical protein
VGRDQTRGRGWTGDERGRVREERAGEGRGEVVPVSRVQDVQLQQEGGHLWGGERGIRRQTAASRQQPAASSQQPAVSSQQPAASSQQPAASRQTPAASRQTWLLIRSWLSGSEPAPTPPGCDSVSLCVFVCVCVCACVCVCVCVCVCDGVLSYPAWTWQSTPRSARSVRRSPGRRGAAGRRTCQTKRGGACGVMCKGSWQTCQTVHTTEGKEIRRGHYYH